MLVSMYVAYVCVLCGLSHEMRKGTTRGERGLTDRAGKSAIKERN